MADEKDFEYEQMLSELDPSIEGDREALARDLVEKKKWEQANPRIQAHVKRSFMEAGFTQSSSTVANPQSEQTAENEPPAPEVGTQKRGRVRKSEAPVDKVDNNDQVPKTEGYGG